MQKIDNIKQILLKSNFEDFQKSIEDYNINDKDNQGNNILHYYIKESSNLKLDYKKIIDLLLNKGIDIDEKQSKGRHKRSPLHLAVFMKLKDITNYLIEKGANINSTDGTGNTPLWTSVMFYREEDSYFIEKLINCGADINHKNDYGISPVELAYSFDNNEGIIKYFPS